MIPTEHEGTVAVDAAARALYAKHVELAGEMGHTATLYDELDVLTRNNVRESVLPQVWAALEALPDRGDVVRRAIASLIGLHDDGALGIEEVVDRARSLADHGWAVDVAAQLDALDPNVDPEHAHSLADDLLLTSVPPEVRAAYERLTERAVWWAGA